MITLLNKFDDNYVLDKKDIYDIADTYIRLNKVEPYLCDIEFTPKKNVLAHYNIKDRKIVFNDERIIESCYSLYDKLQKIYSIDEDHYTYFLNFYYLYIIYHELKHVSQRALFENNSEQDNIYNYLYVLCSILNNGNKVFYKENHDLFPLEIEANNYGYLAAYNLMDHTKLPKKEARIMYLQYLFSLSCNYKKINENKVISPIELLKEKNDLVEMALIEVLLKEARLNKIERMNLGLPITISEYKSIEHERYKSLSKTI